MKKHLLLLLTALLFVPWAMNGQTTTKTVYDGTTTSSYVPAYIFYFDDFTRTQYVIPADDLETLGDGAIISSLTYYCSGTTAYPSSGKVAAPVVVYLKEVGYTSISAFEATSSATTVYTGTLQTVVDGSNHTMTINFDTPYTYHLGNLLIGIENTDDEDYQSVYFYGQTVSGASVGGSNGNSLSSVSPSQRNFIPKTTFTYIPGVISGCIKPTLGEAEYITEEGASFQWTENGTATQWELQYSTSADFTNPTTINRNGIPAYALTGLLSGTTYYVRLRSYCGGAEYSPWSNTVSFNTLCGTFSLPHAYGFEDAGEFECWTVSGSTSTSTGITSATDAPEGSKVFSFHYSERSAYLVSPAFTGTSNGMHVTFQYMNYSASTSYTEQFQVGYTTNASETDPSAYTYGETINGENSWVTYENDFPANTKRIAIKYIYTDAMYLRLDDFHFEVASDCKKPTNLVATEVGSQSATLSWTENGEATAWNLKVNGNLVENVTNPYTLTNLTPETAYTVQVSPVCEEEKWSDAITFTTEVACPAPELTIVETTPFAATFSWTGEAQGYEMEYMVNPSFTFEDGTLQGWTNLIVNADGGQWLHSNDNPGGYMDPTASSNPYYPDLAHNGTGFAMCYSFIDNDGAYNTEAYLVSPRSYLINNGASMNFWYDMANDSYPEYFEVCVATAANPTADDFTAIWTSDAKGSNGQKAAVRHRNTRYQNWREVTIDLSAYAGQTIWIAFHDVNEDMYEVWIDDVMIDDGTIEWTPAPAPIVSPYTLALEPGTEYLVRVRAICGGDDGESAWTTVSVTTPSNCDAPTGLTINDADITTSSAILNWTGYQDSYNLRYRTAASSETAPGSFFEDFESASLTTNGWTVLREGEGTEYTDWRIYDGNFSGGTIPAHSGTYVVMGRSWSSDAYSVDNWLISPQVSLDGELSYWVLDDGEYHEHYDVYVSTTTTETSAFTLVYEPGDASDEWTQHTVDLSSYAGQQGYIAFRLVDEDKDYLFLDDITIGSVIDIPAGEWTDLIVDATTYNLENLAGNTEYEWQVQGINASCDGGVTEWSTIATFSTLNPCATPTINEAEDVTSNSATLSWEGSASTYTLRYRTSIDADIYFNDDLTEYELIDEENGLYGIGDWTTVNLEEGGGNYGGEFVFWYTSNTPQYLISPEVTLPEDETCTLAFLYGAYSASYTESFKVGYSSTTNDVSAFTWGDEITTNNTSGDYFYGTVPAGTKYFAIQCTSDDQYALIMLDFMIYGPVTPAGEWVEIDGVTSPYTLTGLDPETSYDWQVMGEGCDNSTWSEEGWFTTIEQTELTQTIALAAGSNWVSFYVETDLDALKAALVEAMPGTTMTINSFDASTTYNGSRWRGSLSELDLAQMYMIDVTVDGEISLEGAPIDPAEHHIDMEDGAYWIGFPFSENMTVNNAFAGFAVPGDMVSSFEATSTYNGSRWRGGVTELVPGQGYIFESATAEFRTFIYPTSTRKASSLGMGHKTTKNAFNMPAVKKQNSSDKQQTTTVKKGMPNMESKSVKRINK